MNLGWFFFWNYKSPPDNAWHPQVGQNPIQSIDNLPSWSKRTDIEATVVDVAPFIAGVGGFAHMSQLNSLGWTAPASVFRNPTTMMAMHRTTLYLTPLVLLMQAVGFDYRSFIPRWSHEREARRDEEEVRKHVDVGMWVGAGGSVLRMYVFNLGRRYWAPMDVVMGGALADLMHREYCKAHGF